MSLYSFTFILIVACGVFFYRAGEFEGASGLFWGGLSVLISVMIWHWLRGNFFFVLLGQLALYAGITVVRSRKKP